MRGELDFEGALRERVAMLKGLPLGDLQRAYDERVRLNAGARTLVRTMSAGGGRAVLVSGGFTYFTSRVAQAAGFADNRANTLIETGEGLAGTVGEPILGREAKLAALKEEAAGLGIALSQTLAVGDGANDLAMIEADRRLAGRRQGRPCRPDGAALLPGLSRRGVRNGLKRGLISAGRRSGVEAGP
jgi:phosphoserine phosphatase